MPSHKLVFCIELLFFLSFLSILLSPPFCWHSETLGHINGTEKAGLVQGLSETRNDYNSANPFGTVHKETYLCYNASVCTPLKIIKLPDPDWGTSICVSEYSIQCVCILFNGDSRMYLLFGISNWRWIMFWHSGCSHEALGKRGGRTFRGQRSRRIPSTTSGIQTASIPAHCTREGGKHSLSVHILLM